MNASPTGYRIGIIGAGGIVRTSHLPAYAKAGWDVVSISSRKHENAASAAKEFGINQASSNWRDVINNPMVEVLDISLPPHMNEMVCAEAFRAGKPVLLQKPMALDLAAAKRIVEAAESASVPLAINQNGRWDPAIRDLRRMLDQSEFGELVSATMELRTRQPWQTFWEDPDYSRLMIVGMSIHHLDQFRFLFGEPEEVTALTRSYPGQPWRGESIALYCLGYAGGFTAIGFDDGFPWIKEWSVDFRVEGTGAIAMGEIGWPSGGDSTLKCARAADPEVWQHSRFTTKWFPDAFAGTMGSLFEYVSTGVEPDISGRNNLQTMRLVEACYKSAQERRTVKIEEIVL